MAFILLKKGTTFFLLFLTLVSGYAADYYVDAVSGADWQNGNSVAQAFKTIGRLNSITFQPGDNVYFLDGTYTRPGQKLLLIKDSGTAANWITIQNYPGHTPILQFDSWTGIDLVNGASYIAIKGLQVKGARTLVPSLADALNQPGSCANGSGNANGLYNGTGILAVGPNLNWSDPSTTGNEVPHHILVEDCEVYDCTSAGMSFQQADYITVRNCKVYNNCWYTIYGTSGINLFQLVNTDGTTGFHNVIEGNHVFGNQLLVPQVGPCTYWDGNGIIVDDFKHTQLFQYMDPSTPYPAYMAKTLIMNNVAVDNGGSGLHFYLADHCYVYNNTVMNNATQNGGANGNADLRMGTVDNFDVRNNIFSGTKVHHITTPYSNITYEYNYESGSNINQNVGGATCLTCLTTGATFDNTDNSSTEPYKTAENSSVIDQGASIADVTTDYLGITRNIGPSHDIGAYEINYTGACINNTVIPAQIEAEDYSAMSGVQVDPTSDVGGGSNLGFIDAGDYMEYLIYVPKDSTYTIEFRVAGSGTATKTIEVFSDNVSISTIDFSATGGWQTWTTVSQQFALTEGCHTLRLVANTGGFNLNWINFTYFDPTACVGAKTFPGLIEAEDYSFMSGIQTESTGDVGGGSNIAFVDAGDYLDFIVYVPTAGTYSFDMRVAATGADTKSIDIQSDGSTIQTASFPATGGWQTWSTVQTSLLLPAGCQTLRVLFNTTGLNVNWVEATFLSGTFPVEMVGFSAIQNGPSVQLDWATASEINNDYFSVEKSTDGRIWNQLSTIEGAGNSSQHQTYREFDHSLTIGTSYYRLAQVDFDGQVNYSPIRSVKIADLAVADFVEAYPNPTQNTIMVRGASNSEILPQVIEMTGRELTSSIQINPAGNGEFSIDLSSLPNGLYLIRMGTAATTVQKQ